MEPIVVALICTAVFGTIMVIAAFVRQLLLSRDKRLNDEAQGKALAQEAAELEKIRIEMQNNKRYEAHYSVLGANKDAIKYVDIQIEEILSKKSALVERYAQIAVKESGKIINAGEVSIERKAVCDKLREEIDSKLAFYDSELKLLQQRRSDLWDSHIDFERYLLAQEKARNASLDSIYKQHSALLEKVYLRHIDNMEAVAKETIKASTSTFKDMLMAPIQFLIQFFTGGTAAFIPHIAFVQANAEQSKRTKVAHTERDLNGTAADTPKAHPKVKSPTNEETEEVLTDSISFAL